MTSIPTDEDLQCDEDSKSSFPYAHRTHKHLSNLARARATDPIEIPDVFREGIKNAVCHVGDVVNPSTEEIKI